jgi:hypothetical protein
VALVLVYTLFRNRASLPTAHCLLFRNRASLPTAHCLLFRNRASLPTAHCLLFRNRASLPTAHCLLFRNRASLPSYHISSDYCFQYKVKHFPIMDCFSRKIAFFKRDAVRMSGKTFVFLPRTAETVIYNLLVF